MKLAETVTFGGGGLDRAAHIRGDRQSLAEAQAHSGARVIPFWRSKPLVDMSAAPQLAGLAFGHPVLDACVEDPVFLGLADHVPVFAADISAWEPDGKTPDPKVFFDPTEQSHPALDGTERFVELRGVMAMLDPIAAEIAATGKAILGWHFRHGFCAACGAKSEIFMAGWQRDCPACDAMHFPRTDPVVIMLITDGNSVLMGRSPGWPEGMYSLLAGFLEPGETVEAAVRRETYEEAGIRVGRVDYLASQPWPYPSSLMIGCRGAALGRDIRLDTDELEHALWVTREDILSSFAGQHALIKPARNGAIARFLLKNWLADRLD